MYIYYIEEQLKTCIHFLFAELLLISTDRLPNLLMKFDKNICYPYYVKLNEHI